MRTTDLWLPIFWMLFCLPLNGQQKGDIHGVVLDGETGRPLPRANIVLVGTPHGASSDEKGAFAVTGIPVGTYTLKASFVGYGRVKRSV
ncbi:MAG: carboxypeptidase-like regulatory domain-containing protein, partial [Bacteroidota bacterium]